MSCWQLTQKWFEMIWVWSSTCCWRPGFKSLAHLTESLWLKASSHLRRPESIVADEAVSGDVSWRRICLQRLKPDSDCDVLWTVFLLQLSATSTETLCETSRDCCVFTSVAAEFVLVTVSNTHTHLSRKPSQMMMMMMFYHEAKPQVLKWRSGHEVGSGECPRQFLYICCSNSCIYGIIVTIARWVSCSFNKSQQCYCNVSSTLHSEVW